VSNENIILETHPQSYCDPSGMTFMADFGLNGCFGGFGENLGCWDASRNRGTLKYLDNINLSDDPFVGWKPQ
jgi:hypothetical protein